MNSQNIFADLHIHSTASDGLYSPKDLLVFAHQVGLSVVALTDHDTVSGLPEARETSEELGITLVSGIEISCGWEGRDSSVHVLGLYIDENSIGIRELLAEQKQQRYIRAFKIVDLLEKQGIDVSELREAFKNSPEKVIGRPHIARFLLEKGHISDFQEAFTRYLSRGKPAYVPKESVLPEIGVSTIHQAGGFAVLAHPGLIPDWETVWKRISHLQWDGIEVYYAEHSKKQIKKFSALARQRNMFCSGGSDFHGDHGKHLGRLGKFGLTQERYQEIIVKCAEKGKNIE